MELKRLILAWATILGIFIAAFFLFWPEAGKGAIEYTSKLKKELTKKGKDKKTKAKKGAKKKPAPASKEARAKNPLPAFDTAHGKKVKSLRNLVSELWQTNKKLLLAGQAIQNQRLEKKSSSICQGVKLCK